MITLEIYSPGLNESFDFQLDDGMKVRDLITQAASMIAKKKGEDEGGIAEKACLFESGSGSALKGELTLKESGLREGMKLILV